MSLPLREHGAPRLQHPREGSKRASRSLSRRCRQDPRRYRKIRTTKRKRNFNQTSLSPAVDTEDNQDELFTAGDL